MPKISTYDADSAIADNDYVLGNQASPLGTKRFVMSSLATYIAGKIPIGWQTISANLSYTSWDATNVTGVIASDTDLTSIISVGMKLQITQSATVKYFIITAITSSAITVYGGTDYTLTNATISSSFYSALKSPFGFPTNPAKWTVSTTNSASLSTTNTSWTNSLSATTFSMSVPIGAWRLIYSGAIHFQRGSTTSAEGYLSLSTSTTVDSDTDLTVVGTTIGATGTVGGTSPFRMEKTIVVASATTYNLIGKAQGAGVSVGTYAATAGLTVISAVCAYL